MKALKKKITNKRLENFLKREPKYEKLKQKYQNEAKDLLGEDVFENYFLDNDYNFDSMLTEDFFRKKNPQEISLPFSNETISKMIKMPKKIIGTPYNFNYKSHNVYGVYLIGTDEYNRKVLYAFSIVKDKNSKDNRNFHIKLDCLIQGYTALPLLRIDSIGNDHPNYIVDGKVVKSESEVVYVPTPHIHKNSEECQVLSYDDFDYTLANSLSLENVVNQDSTNKYLFKNCIDAFLTYANIDAKINKNIQTNYNYNFNNSLFDVTNDGKGF